MGIRVEEISRDNLADAGKCDGVFTVDSILLLRAENCLIRYTVVPAGPYAKRYPAEAVDYGVYITDPERAVFLAYVNEDIAGQVRLRRHWNRFAYVEDLVVDSAFRRRGVGRALVERAVQWAKDQSLAGVMLETQNNNVAACRLYQQCGFEIGGFDRLLYRGLQAVADEVAVFWYLIFSPEAL